jgi:hypothetical protein
MKKKRTIELANLVINFGDSGLVENLLERFMPIILEGSLKGRGEVKSYRFLKIRLSEIGKEKTPTLFGRLVKVMTIEAEQELDEKKEILVQSSKHMPSAPSSFFTVNLLNHRMAFLGETRRSPSLWDFEKCITKLLINSWNVESKEVLEKILKEEGLERIPKGKTQEYWDRVYKILPYPDVRVTPVPSTDEVAKRFELFNKITSVDISPLKTNNELPDENDEFLKKYSERQKALGSTSAKIKMSNPKKGLEKEETKKLVKAASDGNYKVHFKGQSANGDPLDGNLETLSVKFQEDIEPENDVQRASHLLDKLQEAVDDGLAIFARATEDIQAKAKAVVRAFNEPSNDR